MFLVSFLVCILWMHLSWTCCVSSSFGAVCFGTLTRDEADGIWNCVVALKDPMVGQWWVYRQVPHNWKWERGWESVHWHTVKQVCEHPENPSREGFDSDKRRFVTPKYIVSFTPPPLVHLLFIFSLLTCFGLLTAQWYKRKTHSMLRPYITKWEQMN